MSDVLLSKPKLPPGYLEISVGEPYIVREVLSKFVDINALNNHITLNSSHWEYPYPSGLPHLTSLLENVYGAPVIITNGAKQALGAVFYALKKMGHFDIGMKLPYWALIPPMAEAHKLNSVFEEPDPNRNLAYLLLAPNNPDGQCDSYSKLKSLSENYKSNKVPFIHDAAYYTHSYLPSEYNLGPVGDLQIYSVSKMYGLSGLRLGFIVCHNTSFVHYLKEYVEMMTVGASTLSQEYFYNLFKLNTHFEKYAFEALKNNKKLIKQINPEVLEIPSDVEDLPGMFLFCKVGHKANFDKAKLNVIDGKLFGMPGYVRINLALLEKTMNEVVNRLNSL